MGTGIAVAGGTGTVGSEVKGRVGSAAGLTDNVERLSGRQARSLAIYARDYGDRLIGGATASPSCVEGITRGGITSTRSGAWRGFSSTGTAPCPSTT